MTRKTGIGAGVTDEGIRAMLHAIDKQVVPQRGRRVRLEVPTVPMDQTDPGQQHVGAMYLTSGTTGHRVAVQTAVIKLSGPRIIKRYDTLIGTGISGALLVPTLAYLLGKNFLLVRKKDDKSTHSSHKIEGTTKRDAKVLFVDDFGVSGDTLLCVKKRLAELDPDCHIIGEYYYGGTGARNGGYSQSLVWYK